MSDERDGADSAGTDSGAATGAATDEGDTRSSAIVTRPTRPTGKRSRRPVGSDSDADVEDSDGKPDTESAGSKDDGSKNGSKPAKKTAKKPSDGPSRNPIAYVVNFLKEVVGELRKVIWPNRKQMVNYTTVVLIFLAFMVAMIGLADLGLGKLVMLVFG
ncbi:MAG: preprotein translocase subunit SecE [Actinomycetota bacterium]|nr:preprotein translocase subunit SecE [Actinomycetota bacterium]